MSGSLAIVVLSAPALFVAGAASGFHCALMCAPLHARLAGKHPVALQAGRVTAYAGLGALVGGFGAWWLRPGPLTESAPVVRIALLVFLGLALFLPMRARSCCARRPAQARSDILRTFGIGMAAGLAPCMVVYAALAYAALAGTTLRGAMLMAAFGVGTLPAVMLGIKAWRRLLGTTRPERLRRAAALMVLAAAATLMLVESGSATPGWCVG